MKKDKELNDALEDMVGQFAYKGIVKNKLVYHTGGLSALEHAFSVLGWKDPKPCPENECDEKNCHQEASCGTTTKKGYRRVCGEHYRKLQDK